MYLSIRDPLIPTLLFIAAMVSQALTPGSIKIVPTILTVAIVAFLYAKDITSTSVEAVNLGRGALHQFSAQMSHKAVVAAIFIFSVVPSGRRLSISMSPLFIISNCIVLAMATDPNCVDSKPEEMMPPPPPRPHGPAHLQLLVLVIPILFVSVALTCAGRYLLTHLVRRSTATRTAPPPPAAADPLVIAPITYPPPPYLGGLPRRHSTPLPIFYMLDSLTTVPQEERMIRATPPRRAKPDFVVAALSIVLTFVGLIIAGLSLQYSEHQ